MGISYAIEFKLLVLDVGPVHGMARRFSGPGEKTDAHLESLLVSGQDLDSQVRLAHHVVSDSQTDPELSVLRTQLEQDVASLCEALIVSGLHLKQGVVAQNLKVLL